MARDEWGPPRRRPALCETELRSELPAVVFASAATATYRRAGSLWSRPPNYRRPEGTRRRVRLSSPAAAQGQSIGPTLTGAPKDWHWRNELNPLLGSFIKSKGHRP